MRQVSTSIVIAAPPARVWHVLTNFAAYAEWNPFMPAISGHIDTGSVLNVRIVPPGGKAMTFKPTVLVAKENQELRWRGRLILPGLFDGEHYFQLSPTQDGTLLEHGESFKGLIVRLIGSTVFQQTEKGFMSMNEALKKRAES